MQTMMSPEIFKEKLDGSGLYKLEIEKNRLQNKINGGSFVEIEKEYLKTVEELISNEINILSNMEPFKLYQLKYTKYHWMSGEISDGSPITTSIEIKPEIPSDKWKVEILHKYYNGDDFEEKIISKQYDLPGQETILDTLENNDLRLLKNNYFSSDKTQRYSHWELEYNNYFKITGTFDNVPSEIKKVITTLNCENIINEALSKVDEEIKSIQE